jgi:hypothetical protein
MQMDYIDMYTQVSLAEKKWVCRHRIPKDKDKYIPVRVITAVTKRNKSWYWLRYLDKEEVMQYIKSQKKSWKSEK